MYVKCKWYSVVTQSRIWYNLIKAARKTDADAGLARAYADIFRAPASPISGRNGSAS